MVIRHFDFRHYSFTQKSLRNKGNILQIENSIVGKLRGVRLMPLVQVVVSRVSLTRQLWEILRLDIVYIVAIAFGNLRLLSRV